ncbi:hypothetical protein LguiB_010261 [Lonicera macranthoides]
MACKTSNYATPQQNTLLPSIVPYILMITNSISTIYKAYQHQDYLMIVFIVLVLLAFLLLEYLSSVYRYLPSSEKSNKKYLLKCAIWFIYSAILFGFACQFAPLFGLSTGILIYGIFGVCSAVIFYAYMIYEEEDASSEYLSDEETKHYDFILEKV